MTYEVGQKVETPLGVGLIVASRLDSYVINELYEVRYEKNIEQCRV